MSRATITVRSDATFKEIVALLSTHRIGALPVVDEVGFPIGIISETDLLLKEIYSGAPDPLFEFGRRRLERHKAEALVAADLMTSPVVTISTGAWLQEAARKIHDGKVKRLLVVGPDGRLAGIVTRSDLLHVFLRPDLDIRRDIVDDVLVRTLWMDPNPIDIQVVAGYVTLGGTVDRLSDIAIITRLVGGVEGVVGVEDDLSYRYDDIHAAPSAWPIPI